MIAPGLTLNLYSYLYDGPWVTIQEDPERWYAPYILWHTDLSTHLFTEIALGAQGYLDRLRSQATDTSWW